MKELDEFFARHSKIVLQFSGGKDSTACLWLLEPYWDRLMVLWCDHGDPAPDVVEHMQMISKLVPHFTVIHGHSPQWIAQHGYPVDILPLKYSGIAPLMGGLEEEIMYQPFSACCYENLWKPMSNWVVANEVTGVIRGQKVSDSLKSPVRSGEVIQGVEYLFPIEDWDDEKVLAFLGVGKLPQAYKKGATCSVDCMLCTAYAEEMPGRLAYLEKEVPERAALVKKVIGSLHDDLIDYVGLLEDLK